MTKTKGREYWKALATIALIRLKKRREVACIDGIWYWYRKKEAILPEETSALTAALKADRKRKKQEARQKIAERGLTE